MDWPLNSFASSVGWVPRLYIWTAISRGAGYAVMLGLSASLHPTTFDGAAWLGGAVDVTDPFASSAARTATTAARWR